MAANLPNASLFSTLTPILQPIAAKSRQYNENDQRFIKEGVRYLLKDRVIEPNMPP